MRAGRAGTDRIRARPLGPLPSGEPVKILEVQNLRVGFPVVGGVFARKIAEVRAVDGVSFTLEKGETLGVVGESGCGKSTVGRAIVNILRAMVYGVEISGSVFLPDRVQQARRTPRQGELCRKSTSPSSAAPGCVLIAPIFR